MQHSLRGRIIFQIFLNFLNKSPSFLQTLYFTIFWKFYDNQSTWRGDAGPDRCGRAVRLRLCDTGRPHGWGAALGGGVDIDDSRRVKRLGDMLKSLRSSWIPEAEVRAEAWALGGRHRGEVVAGARSELTAPGISVRRAILLRAVIRRRADERPCTYGPNAVAKRNDEETDR